MNAKASQISNVAPGRNAPVERHGGAGLSSLGGRRRSFLEPVREAFLGRDPLRSAEADVASLTTRRDGVLKRLAAASAKADEAAAEQRRLLVETTGEDAAALKRTAEACRRAQDDLAALRDAAQVLAEMTAEAEARVASERNRIERERIAAEIAARTDHLSACIATEERAVLALAEAHQATRLAAYAAIQGLGPAVDAESLIGELKAVSLHVAYPVEYNIAPFSRSIGAPCSTLASAASTYLAQLRSEAEAIRDGSAPMQTASVGEAA